MPNLLRHLMIVLMAAGGVGGMFGGTMPQAPRGGLSQIPAANEAPPRAYLVTTPLFEALAARAVTRNALRRHAPARSTT